MTGVPIYKNAVDRYEPKSAGQQVAKSRLFRNSPPSPSAGYHSRWRFMNGYIGASVVFAVFAVTTRRFFFSTIYDPTVTQPASRRTCRNRATGRRRTVWISVRISTTKVWAYKTARGTVALFKSCAGYVADVTRSGYTTRSFVLFTMSPTRARQGLGFST